jgi:hypothetical protein
VVAVDVSLKQLSKKLDDFAKERDWEQYHNPRNRLLAMVCIFSLPLSLIFLLLGLQPFKFSLCFFFTLLSSREDHIFF